MFDPIDPSDPRHRRITLLTVDPCRYCGAGSPDSIRIDDCPPPTKEELYTVELYVYHCVTAPRFLWCRKMDMLSAFFGEGPPPADLPAHPIEA